MIKHIVAISLTVTLWTIPVTANAQNEQRDLENLEKLLSIITELEKKTTHLEKELNRMRGAVIAFETKEASQVCPDGWELYEPVKGRFIVGAGNHSNKDVKGEALTNHVSYADDKGKAVGGAEQHVLKIPEIPAHGHKISAEKAPSGANMSDFLGGSTAAFGLRRKFNSQPGKVFPHLLEDTGGGQPHNNMPPYIALYFCKKK